MFLYQIIDNHIQILGYRGYDGSVCIPEKIENLPVTELSAYAFSHGWGRDRMLSAVAHEIRFCDEEGSRLEGEMAVKDLPAEVTCERLKDLYLPPTIKKIGNYAFYNCLELTHVECWSTISDLGSGLFTGCYGIRFLDLHIAEGRRSCMKEILSELHQKLYVNYHSHQGEARLLFPEMYEESVEHTPARIIIREMHGCGHMYRYCFAQSEFQFHKYDSLLPHLQAQESEQVALSLVMGRLFTPLNLIDHDKRAYETYLAEHLEKAAKLALEDSDPALFLWLARQYGHEKKDFDAMVEMAGKANRPEILSVLMNLRRRRFPAEKRSFSL